MSHNLALKNQEINKTLSTSLNDRRSIRFRRRLESYRRNGQSLENNTQRSVSNSSRTQTQEPLSQINNASSTIDINSNMNITQNENISSRNNQSSLTINQSPINDFKRIRTRHLGREMNKKLFVPVYKKKIKKLNEIEEEEKKKEEICAEENIGSEIKDTVKCYNFLL